MNFLIIDFEFKDQEESIPLQAIRILDEEMSLQIIFLTYNVHFIEYLSRSANSRIEFVTYIDEKCKITNNGKIINSNTVYNELEFTEHETDEGTVHLATIQILKKD